MPDSAKLRAWWSRRQGLDGSLAHTSPAEALATAGWARSVGGANPYLAIHARTGASREQIDAASGRCEIHELPSARGCTYIVPAEHFALALAAGSGASQSQDVAMATKHLGVTPDEIARLSDRVQEALGAGPLDPKQLKDALGDAVRSLGAEGKKRGMTTTLPLALGRLQALGSIRRVPTNGRLDQQRYAYSLWSPNPMAGFRLSPEEVAVQLARLYFGWIGPASIAHFRWFSGYNASAAKAATAELGLVPVESGSELLSLPEHVDSFHRFATPAEPDYRLVGSIDGITHLRRDVAGLLESEDTVRTMRGERGIVAIGGVQDLSSHAIVDRGRIVGLWEFDPNTQTIAWNSFVGRSAPLDDAVAKMETFIREQLGDARSFSLDSPESRKPRIDALRNS